MAEPKFKRGQTVTILSRAAAGYTNWENTHNGGNAIVESHYVPNVCDSSYDDKILYRLWLLYDGEKRNRSLFWFEEKFLELYCSNEERGLKILADAGR